MIQATFRLVAPAGKRKEFLDVLLYLKGPTEALPECRACWICQDATNDNAIIYLVQWDTQEDLESHLRSERFRRLLPYIEMSVEPPAVSFGSIEHIRGIEFLVEVLSAKTQ
jgi:quinol monooxygenase YgiN